MRTERLRRKRPAKGSNLAYSHSKLRFENSQELYLVFHKSLGELEIFKCIYNT